MQRSHSWFFYLCALEGALALFALLLVPSEGGSISLSRLTLIVILLGLCGLWIYLGVRPPGELNRLARPEFIISSALLFVTFGLSLFFLRYLNPERLLPIYERMSPLLWYLLVLSIQTVFFLLYLRNGFHFDSFQQRKSIYHSSLLAFCLLFTVFLFVSITRLGVTSDPAYWAEPGVAILGWQFALALLGGILVLSLPLRVRDSTFDILIPLAIYILSISLWLSVPLDVLTNGFYVNINPPTFQPFPYSDAGYYDQMAHSLLVGHPYLGEIPTRPLFIVFLAFLHKIFGENYPGIILGQSFLLAFIPVVLYALGKKLHSRTAGVTVALFFIFRELTSLLITSNTRVTNSKSLLVDLPTLLLLALSCYFTARWLDSKDKTSAFVAGGMFGLLLLLRTQSMLVLPFILLAALLVIGWRSRFFYQLTSLFVLGLIVTVVPWLTHNYLQTGQITFDSPFQYNLIASQYAYSGNLDISNNDIEGKGLGRVLIEFAMKDPKFVFGFIANHFLATEIGGMLALPLIKPYNGIPGPVNLYWVTWDGNLEWYNVVLFILYLAVISFGIGAAWKRGRWIGLLPLAYNIGYSLATALSRFSGWRYDFPADWVPYFYFGIGFAEIILLISSIFGAKEELEQEKNKMQHKLSALPVLALMFAFIGGLPWIAENIASPRYLDQTIVSLEQKITSISNAPPLQDIQTFTSQSGSFLQTGRILYPRFFIRDKGLISSNPWPAYEPRDYSRLGFLLLNQKTTFGVFPSKRIPEPFPHAADAIVLGCQREDYVEVRLVAFPELDVILLSAPLTEPCSP